MSGEHRRPDEPRRPDEQETYHRAVYDWDDPDGDGGEIHSRGLDFGLLLLRLGTLALVPHGVDKLGDLRAFTDQVATNAIGGLAPELIAWAIALGQVVLPAFVVVGLFTRPAAFLTAAMMAGIWALTIAARLDYRVLTDSGALTGEPAILYVVLTLPLAFTGAGRWSLDAMRTSGRP